MSAKIERLKRDAIIDEKMATIPQKSFNLPRTEREARIWSVSEREKARR